MRRECGSGESSLQSQSPEIVLLVSPPACGKSTLAVHVFERQLGYVRVNRDSLGSMEKCLQYAKQTLSVTAGTEGRKSVVVDNTNTEVAVRRRWVSLAKEMNVEVSTY